MPKLSRRKQSKPHHICSDDEDDDMPIKTTRSSAGKKAIADDNGNILTPRTRSGKSRDVRSNDCKRTRAPHTRGKRKTCDKLDRKEDEDDIDEDELLASGDNSDESDNEKSANEHESELLVDNVETEKPERSEENLEEEADEKADDNSSDKHSNEIPEEKSDEKDNVIVNEAECDNTESSFVKSLEDNEEEEKANDDTSTEKPEMAKDEDKQMTSDDNGDDQKTETPDEITGNAQPEKMEMDEEEGADEMDEDSENGELKIVEDETLEMEMSSDCQQQQHVQALMAEDTPRGSIQHRTCQYCDAVKKSPADLQRHLRKHTGERPFKCQLCNRMFKAKRSLQYHQFMHHGIQTKNSNISQKYSQMRKRKLEMDQLKAEISNKKLKTETGSMMDLADGVVRRHDGKDSSTSPESSADTDGSSDRVCQVCGKICLKPSDLKRHMMSHTGERPFKCDICGKPFRAKNSMLYHQKSAHGLDIELSPGLEERFMKLKKQNQLNIIGLGETNQLSDMSRVYSTATAGDYDFDDIDSISDESSFLSKPVMCSTSRKNKLMYDLNTADEDDEVELDEATGLFKPRGPGFKLDAAQGASMVGMEIVQESNFKKSRISIRNETVLVTRLDGINVGNNQETSLYKCYLCGKLFNYLSKVQCHLSMHFEKDIVIYQCELCKSSFWFKNQVMQHVRRKHPEEARQEAAANAIMSMTKNREVEETSNSDMDSGIQLKSGPLDDHSDSVNSDSIENIEKEESGTPSTTQDQMENNKELFQANDSGDSLCRFWRGLKYRKNVNGSYVCLVCRKSFHREISLLKHIKIHSTHKMCFCQECGKGFSEYSMLKQHLCIYHNKNDSQKPHIRPATKSTLLSNLLRKTAEDPHTGRDPVSEEIAQVEKAREILMKEGIQEDVTVVMPCGPEDEQPEDSSPRMDIEHAWSEKESEDSQGSSGIQTAPKRSLIPELPQTKSKRKSSQPVKLNSEDSVKSSPSLSTAPLVNGTELNNNSMPSSIEIKQEPMSPKSESPPVTKTQLTPSQANPHVAQFLMAQGSVMNQALNSFILANSTATSGAPQPTMLLSNSFLPQMTSAGTISGIPINQVMMPVSVQVPNGDKSQMPGSKDPSPSPVPSTSADASPALSGSGSGSEREQLVGFPRVQWSPSDGSTPASGNWQWNTIATDGRKVTSLSRTHSRLPIVNAPVNRDKVCKPTYLSDGRQVYRCPFCSKDFLSYSDINRHMDFHEDIRPYKCKYCDYYARTNSQLKVHMMRHQGIREFCCKVCNYKGVTQSDLNRHMKSQIHVLKSRNECQHCGEGFVTPKNLEKHQDGNCIVKVQKMEYGEIKIEAADSEEN